MQTSSFHVFSLALMFMMIDVFFFVYFCTLYEFIHEKPQSDDDSEGWMLRKKHQRFWRA